MTSIGAAESSTSTLWSTMVGHLSFTDQIEVAKGMGCTAISITPPTYFKTLVAGISTTEMKSRAADGGVKIAHFDPLCRWLPAWMPNNTDVSLLPILNISVDDALWMMEALEVTSATAIVTAPKKDVPSLDYVTEHFAALCDTTSGIGVRCDLEFIPGWGLPSLDEAISVVQSAGRPNSGIMFDTWHFRRSGGTDDELRSAPVELLTSVQISDGPIDPDDGVSLVHSMMYQRQMPGTGEFEIDALLDVLRERGVRGNIGLEVLSLDLADMGVRELIALLRDGNSPL